jgi:hypothetical protein
MIAILHIADTQSDKKQMERRGKILRIEELKVKAAITELIETCLNNTFLEFCGEREKYDNVRSSYVSAHVTGILHPRHPSLLRHRFLILSAFGWFQRLM